MKTRRDVGEPFRKQLKSVADMFPLVFYEKCDRAQLGREFSYALLITEVSDMFPKLGADTTPVAKVSFVTKAGDLGCGVGYYK